MKLLFLSSFPDANSDGSAVLLFFGFIMIVVLVIMPKINSYEKRQKEKNDDKLNHQNFIVSTTNNFPALKINYYNLSPHKVELTNDLKNPNSWKKHGEIKVLGELTRGKYNISATVKIGEQEFRKECNSVENSIEELTKYIAMIVVDLMELEQVKNAIILTQY